MVDEEKITVSLKVQEARRQKDVGKNIARINAETMKAIGVKNGDIIEIIGNNNTSAEALPADYIDQDRSIIRIDGFIRKNCDISIDEYVTVRKADVCEATYIKLAPVGLSIDVDADFLRFVKDKFKNRAMRKGDTHLITFWGRSVPFTVLETLPDDVVKISEKTELAILNFPEGAPIREKIGAVGNTLILTIPSEVTKILQISEGDIVEIEVDGKGMIVKKIK